MDLTPIQVFENFLKLTRFAVWLGDFKSVSSNIVLYSMLISLDYVADNGMEITCRVFINVFLSRSLVMGYHFPRGMHSGAAVIY